MKSPLVEIIILTHNSRENVGKCLDSLKKTKYPNLKISVVDQASSDGTSEYIKKNYSGVNLIINERNKSFSEGNNDLLKKSDAKYCILLNDDTIHNPNWVKELVKFAEKSKDFASLQPKVKDMKNKKMFEYASGSGGFIDIYGYPVCRGRIFDKIEEDTGQYDDAREIFWSGGVSMLLNMNIIRKISYLDEDFGSYAEELDLCWRAQLAGYKNFVVPKSVVYHLGSGTWGRKKYNSRKEFLIQRNHLIILFKNYSFKSLVKILPVRFILEFITFVRFMAGNPKKSFASFVSSLWILKNLPKLIRKNRTISKLRKIPDNEIKGKMINKSVVIDYFLSKRKDKFSDFIPYIKDY